jgi:protease I
MNSRTSNESLQGRRIAFLLANEGVEEVELVKPWQAVEEAGGEPVLLAPEVGNVQAFNHLDRGGTYEATVAVGDAEIEQFAGLVLPGGVANPDRLRLDDAAVTFVNTAFLTGTPVAAICHAPWMLIEAGVVAGRRLTSWPSLRTDLLNADAEWVDQEVVTCDRGANVLVTSRKPDDLPAFCAEVVATFASRNPVGDRAAT